MQPAKQASSEAEAGPRVIKRYSNRKLYDTRDSRYITLQQIGELVRCGEEVQIIDNATKEDKTEVTLALIISEDLKAKPRSVPLGTLRNLIQERSERLLTQLREGPIGRLIPGHPNAGQTPDDGTTNTTTSSEAAPTVDEERPRTRLSEIVETSRQTLEDWHHAVDERVRAIVPKMGLFRDLQSDVKSLAQRIEQLESRLLKRDTGKIRPDVSNSPDKPSTLDRG